MSPAQQEPLALAMPLAGCQLIEASAGTGKTFTIALLYVRLVLGQRKGSGESAAGDHAPTPLLPPEILVVTFTEAASLELRDRIRQRLVQAAEAFRSGEADDGLAAHDPLLAGLREGFPSAAWPSCARSLELAAQWMDDAAISTIHSWAQRMLREHAFDSGRLFQQELVKDLSAVELEAVTDYWRSRVYPLSEVQAAVMVDLFASPQALHGQLRKLLQRPDARLTYADRPVPDVPPGALLAELEDAGQALQAAESVARSAYRADPVGVREALAEMRPVMNGNVFKNKNKDDVFAGWLTELSAWGDGTLQLADCGFVQRLAPQRCKLNGGAEPPHLALFDALRSWHEQRAIADDALARLRPAVLADARTWVSRRLAAQLESRAQMGFDDMIQGLDRALAGDAGDALARRIRAQFPLALIDEFQDTDPAQYRIFERIYRVGEQADAPDSTGLVLIGDPKQAIYGFRGGDIHTYLMAREATRGSHHALDRNFRSSAAAVDAVNHLFQRAETEHPRAAFRFADGQGEWPNPLPFHPVQAQGRREQLVLDGRPAAGLTAWLLEGDGENGSLGTVAYRRAAAQHCADRIAGWLNQARAGKSGLRSPEGGELTPLVAGDIAVLVRDRKEAAAIRTALSERGLASVYLSDSDSVFATAEARDLLCWLRAIASPGDVAALRTALATATLGQSLDQLDALQRDEMAWEAIQERFLAYRQHWQRRGVLPALRQLLHDFRVPEELLGLAQGERVLTNLLHLAEWAQQASDSLDGDHALIRLLAGHIADPGSGEQVVRLESDEQLIQVVTVFKSKGLEYPLVALPFACSYREVSARYGSPLYHDEHEPVLELASNRQLARDSFDRADDERLSEDLRLLYVALTRARYATFVGLAPLADGKGSTLTLHKSALGYLLAGGETIPDAASLHAHWQSRVAGCAAIAAEAAGPAAAALAHDRPGRVVVDGSARTAGARAFKTWWIASYSALRHRAIADAPETAGAEVHDEEHENEGAGNDPLLAHAPEAGTLHAFPRGPGPGTFLHVLLEDLANAGFARALQDEALLTQITERCRRRGWEVHAPALHAGLASWLSTPLAPAGENGPTLAGLQRYRAEPDFWFATGGAASQSLDCLLCASLFPDAPRPLLARQHLNGLMKGFIDLLAEHEGRFYVIDWKSNWLGADDQAYAADSMEQALLEKRYDLQMAIYLVALHRHLQHTLGDAYDYERDVGGAMLVFLRGINAPSRGVVRIKPSLSVVEALDDCLAGVGGDSEGARERTT